VQFVGKRANLGRNVEIGFCASVEDGTKIGNNVKIGPFCQIITGSVIEDNCIIGGNCTIGHPTKLEVQKVDFSADSPKVKNFYIPKSITEIGKGSVVRSGSIIYKHVVIDENLRTGHNILIREHVNLGKKCVVGTNAILDGYIQVGDNSMIQSHCYIAQSVKLGSYVFISPGCIFLDNKKIILGQGLEGAVVEDFVRIGGGTKILPGVTIGKYALIGAGSIVARNIPSKAIAYGAPVKVKAFQADEDVKKYVDSIVNWQ